MEDRVWTWMQKAYKFTDDRVNYDKERRKVFRETKPEKGEQRKGKKLSVATKERATARRNSKQSLSKKVSGLRKHESRD